MRPCAMMFLATLSLIGLSGIPGRADDAKPDKQAEQDIRKIEDDWLAAEIKHDAAKASQFIADDYQVTTPTGDVKTKEQFLKDLKSGEFTIESAEQTDKKVRVYGNTAVVNATFIVKKGKLKGDDLSGEYTYTNVYVKKDGRWQCVSGHFTSVVKK